MAKFKAEITSELRKELETFLEDQDMTKADFLRLAIRAKDYLVASESDIASSVVDDDDIDDERAAIKEEVEALVRRTAARKAARRSASRRAEPLRSSSLDKIIETNRKLYDRFLTQAEMRGLNQKEYAEKLGFSLKQIQRIKVEKAISFVPKLKAALDKDDE